MRALQPAWEFTADQFKTLPTTTQAGEEYATGEAIRAWAERRLSASKRTSKKLRRCNSKPVSRVPAYHDDFLDLRAIRPGWDFAAGSLATLTTRPQRSVVRPFDRLPSIELDCKAYVRGEGINRGGHLARFRLIGDIRQLITDAEGLEHPEGEGPTEPLPASRRMRPLLPVSTAPKLPNV